MPNKLTILLPVKDRPSFTIRCLRYFNEIHCEYRIIIADGSLNEDTLVAIESKRFSNIDYEYLRFPPDYTYKDFILKMNKALAVIDSDYIYWACDDDFINFDCLKKGILFLDQNLDYSMYTGQVLNFEIPCAHGINKHFGEIIIGDNIYSMPINVEQNEVINRLSSFHSLKPFEAIHRTSNLESVFHKAFEFKITHHYELSALFNYVIIIAGKARVSSELIVLRQHDTPNSAGSLIWVDPSPLGYFKHSDFQDFIFNKIIPFVDSQIISSVSSRALEGLQVSIEIMRNTIQFYDRLIKKVPLENLSLQSFFHKVIPSPLLQVLRYFKSFFRKCERNRPTHSTAGLKYLPIGFFEIVSSISFER